MATYKAFCFLFFLLVGLHSCRSKAIDNTEEIPVALLQEDFRILRKTLEEAHPGLYWYSSEAAMRAYFDSTYSLLKQDMTDAQFFKLLLPLIAQIRCVHTNLSFSKQTQGQAFIVQKGLPFVLYITQNKAFIQESYADSTQEGLQLMAINHIPVQKLLTRFLPYFTADGYNETFKYYVLSQGGFLEAYASLIGQPNYFVIDALEPATGKAVHFTVAAQPQEKINQLATAERNSQQNRTINLVLKPRLKTAILTINTFAINTENFRDTIRTCFTTIHRHGIKHLIIDVRNNGGGNNSNVTELFSYLAQKPFRHLKRTEMLSRQYTYFNYITKPADFQHLRKIPNANGTYSMNYLYPGTSYMNPVNRLSFKGQVFVLCNGATVSAASELVALAHGSKRAVIIGEETGGGYYGATGGRYINLILPNSQLKVRIPLIRIYTDVPEDFVRQPKGRGTLPDYALKPTVAEVKARKDVQLAAALKFCAMH